MIKIGFDDIQDISINGVRILVCDTKFVTDEKFDINHNWGFECEVGDMDCQGNDSGCFMDACGHNCGCNYTYNVKEPLVKHKIWVEDPNPLMLEEGKSYWLQYTGCESSPYLANITHFTRFGHPWQVCPTKANGIVSPGSYKIVKNPSVLNALSDYFKTTSKEQIKADMAAIDDWNEVGPSMGAMFEVWDKSYALEPEAREEHKKVTGFDTPKEYYAYELGMEHREETIIKWINKWDGGTNSGLGMILERKFTELNDNNNEAN
jgi:hypothetical protein